MSVSDFNSIWPDIVTIRPRKVIFTGGEPLLRPDLLELLRGLADADQEHAVYRCLNTNGHLVNLALSERLVGLVDEVRVSLDGMPALNDSLRGGGNFSAAVQALDALSCVGFEPRVLITVSSVTKPDLEDLLCFLVRKGFTRINLNPFRTLGRGLGREDLKIDLEEVRTILHGVWSKCFPEHKSLLENSVHDGQAHCGVGGSLNVLPNGDVFPCHALTHAAFRCGNLKQDRLVDICRCNGLLGKLASLDFGSLSSAEPEIGKVIRRDGCLGAAYQSTKPLNIWNDFIPLANLSAGA